ncbi:MAG: NAD(P)H-hydrate dehydratase [Elusimicrobia bacterium]|nr:NAD(P)H-hydrate dehydratase [Elusimicrobiota bacterium]
MKRRKDAHKGDFGHVLVVAGSPSMLGAAALTGLSAMRAGAGLTTIAVARSLNLTLQGKISNVIMTRPLPETSRGTVALRAFDLLKKDWTRYSAVALGPGMTTTPGTVRFVEKMYLECPFPMVVDADALNALALRKVLGRKACGQRVLTPHPGEMARLTGLSKEMIRKDRRAIARKYAKDWGCTVVLKGPGTVVASPDGKVYVNRTGGPELATAGSGDVLTGLVASLMAQGLDEFHSARQGAYLHGLTGDRLSRQKTRILATDLIEAFQAPKEK